MLKVEVYCKSFYGAPMAGGWQDCGTYEAAYALDLVMKLEYLAGCPARTVAI